jgi:YgiT-type zinc finger domain-containing protein
MKCRVCGGALEPRVTDLPFKVSDSSIVILKALPGCSAGCGDVELENAVMLKVEQIVASTDRCAELEIICYAV